MNAAHAKVVSAPHATNAAIATPAVVSALTTRDRQNPRRTVRPQAQHKRRTTIALKAKKAPNPVVDGVAVARGGAGGAEETAAMNAGHAPRTPNAMPLQVKHSWALLTQTMGATTLTRPRTWRNPKTAYRRSPFTKKTAHHVSNAHEKTGATHGEIAQTVPRPLPRAHCQCKPPNL